MARNKQMDSAPVFYDGTEYPAGQLRRTLHAMIGDTIGIFGPNDFAVTLTGSTVTVSPGRAAIPSAANEVGGFLVEATSATVLTLDPADQTRDRVDRLTAYVVGPTSPTDTGKWFLEIVNGNPEVNPQPPTTPNAFIVADFLVPSATAGTNPSMLDRRYTSGQHYIAGPTLFSGERPAADRPGQIWVDRTTRRPWIHNGTTWTRLSGVPVVTTTTEVVAPYTDEIVFDRTTGALRKYSGTAGNPWPDLRSTVPYGKRWLTTGFFNPSTSDTTIPMSGQRVQGGITTSTYGLVLPSDGMYRVQLFGYATTGSSNRVTFRLYRSRSGTSNIAVLSSVMWKPTGDDFTTFQADEMPLKAGDGLYMTAAVVPGPGGTWGTGETEGSRFSVEYNRPLPPGVLPV